MIGRIVRLLFFLALLVPFAGAFAAYLAIDGRPAIDRAAEFTPDNIERAKRILDEHDPRKRRGSRERVITVTAAEVDLAANYLLNRYAEGSGRVELANGRAHVAASLPMPAVPFAAYVNLDATLREGAPFPEVERLRVGSLPLPSWLVTRVVDAVLGRTLSDGDRQFFRTVVKGVTLDERQVALTYEARGEVFERLQDVLVTPEEQERLHAYHTRLVTTTESLPGPNASLVELMSPLFALAVERSRTADPIAENRSALVVLSAYANGQPLSRIVPDARAWPRARGLRLSLAGRGDFALHYIISAAIAASAGGPLADVVGLWKEISDSRGGSGFSFNDLAADRAGSRLGELAETPASARRLQARLARPLTDRDVIPETRDLPEFMSAREFETRYGGVGGPEYNRMLAEINRRVAALPALQ